MTDEVKTLADLARIAGVSVATVSRSLAGSPLIAQETRERILELAEAHRFRPNQMARNLRTKKTGSIGVVIPLGHEQGQALSDPFFMQMLGHLADALAERGQNLLLSRVIPERPDWLDRIIRSGHVDGVIVVGQSDQGHALERAAASHRQMVVWGGYSPGQGYCSVGSDNLLGGEIAAAHLLACGCRAMAFFGDPRAPEVAQRLDGFRSHLLKAGGGDKLAVVPVHLTAESANRDIQGFFEGGGQRPDGIFAASDVIAMNALRILAERGLRAPHDVRVVGFDDLPLASQTTPTLTTIRQDVAEGAKLLVDLLFRRIAGEETQSISLKPQLVERGSTSVWAARRSVA